MDSPRRYGKLLAAAFTLLTVVSVAVLLASWFFEASAFRRPALVVASTGYVLVALSAGARHSAPGMLTLAALVFCWLGDFLGPGNFLLGAAMFLLAHVLFVPAFLLRGTTGSGLALGLAAAAALTAAVMWWLHEAMPPEQRSLMYGYAVVIALMLGAALGTWPAHRQHLVPLAAVVFYVSDLFLAQTAFLDGGRIWTYTGYPLYYLACLLFAWNAGQGPRTV